MWILKFFKKSIGKLLDYFNNDESFDIEQFKDDLYKLEDKNEIFKVV